MILIYVCKVPLVNGVLGALYKLVNNNKKKIEVEMMADIRILHTFYNVSHHESWKLQLIIKVVVSCDMMATVIQ